MLDRQAKARIRAHLGVPVQGISDVGFSHGYRYFEGAPTGLLEFRMNNLQPHEESLVLGRRLAEIRIFGQCNIGDAASITVNGADVRYTVQQSDQGETNADTLFSVAKNFANLIGISNPDLFAAGGPSIGNIPQGVFPGYATITLMPISQTGNLTVSATTAIFYSAGNQDISGVIATGGISQKIANSDTSRSYLIVQNLSSSQMWINVTGGSALPNAGGSYAIEPGSSYESQPYAPPVQGISLYSALQGNRFSAEQTVLVASATVSTTLLVGVVDSGSIPPISYTQQSSGVTYTGFLPICDYLKSQTVQGDAFAAFEQADVVKFSQKETEKRVALYQYWCQQLADYFGVPCYPRGRNHYARGGLSI